MKTTIFQFAFCILVFATTVLSSCKKEEPIVSGSVTGTVKVYDPSKPSPSTIPLRAIQSISLHQYPATC